ncbi:hypothetical protein GBA52_028867 [Prunus armeniaca]|nr:hypothetical protein GBA52_028867 [Prunus armeniaca]
MMIRPRLYIAFFASKTQVGNPLQLYGEDDGLTVLHNFGHNNFTGTLPSLPIAHERLGKQTLYAFLVGENKLTGTFPVSLVALNLSWNMLQGQIPTSLGQIRDLRYLSLSGNNLTGTIPSSLGQLYSLEVLELSSNYLTGEIPKDLVNLGNLTVLLLDKNNLSGQIPSGLANVTALSSFNVSFNNFSGSLPSNNNLMKCNAAIGNPYIHSCPMFSLTQPSSDSQGRDGDSQPYAASPVGVPASRSGNFNSIEIASITSASAIVSVLLALVVLFLYIRKVECKVWSSRVYQEGSYSFHKHWGSIDL